MTDTEEQGERDTRTVKRSLKVIVEVAPLDLDVVIEVGGSRGV